MKRYGNLWEKIISYENLYLAYKKAKKGKGWRKSIKVFEKDIEGNLLKLQQMLISGQFNTSKYATKIVYEPKKRTIYKLPFYPDRIVQHALLQVVLPIWNSVMIYDSYACRNGKGMHEASTKVMNHVRSYKYCLKADIRKFYPSIDHEILMKIIENKIKCEPTLNLLRNIVFSYPGGKNAPIGNYTSQWFGNLYMNELDWYIKQNLKTKAYIRYCDDFVLFGNNKKELHHKKELIEKFVKDKLDLRFSKSTIFPVTQGVDFLGYRHFKEKKLLRKSTVNRVKRRISSLPAYLKTGIITLEQFRSSIASTEGWIKWANSYNFRTFLGLQELKETYL